MKKTTVFLFLIAASTQLKAQQLLQPQPNIKLNDGLQNTFKPATPLTPQQMLIQPKATWDKNLPVDNGGIIYSNMPVVKVSSLDRMPMLVPGERGVSYTMLIKRVTVIDPNSPVEKPLMP